MKSIISILLSMLMFFNTIGISFAEELNVDEDEPEWGIGEGFQDDFEGSVVEEDDIVTGNEPYTPPDVPLSDESDRRIVGSDDRYTIYNTKESPYCAIAYLHAKATCGCSWTGTGFMVGPRGFVTAGHCVYCETHHTTVDKLTLYFGYKSKNDYFYKFTGGFRYWYNYKDGYDYCYMLLKENVGNRTGWFGTHALSDKGYEDYYFSVTGYRDGVLKSDYDRVVVTSDHKVKHYADTLPGNSGCPIYYYDYMNDSNYVVAINTAHSESYEVNYGERITNTLFNRMKEQGIFD